MKNLIYIFLAFFCFGAYAQEKKLIWDYPIQPDTEGWNKCNSAEEIYQTLQVPDKILKELDTESLVDICLNYPARLVFNVYNVPQASFDAFYLQFNGIRELMDRKDVGKFLSKKYADMSMNRFNNSWTLVEQGAFVAKFSTMELFLAQSSALKSLDDKDRKQLIKESIKKFDLKKSRNELFGGNSMEMTTWVMAKILWDEKQLSDKASSNSNIETSLKTGSLWDFDLPYVYGQAKIFTSE